MMNRYCLLPPRSRRRTGGWPWAGLVLFLPVLWLVGAADAFSDEVNIIKSIKGLPSGVEIELVSTTPFVQSDLPVLHIGDREFTISRSSDDGDVNTIIFILSSDEFAQVASGDRVLFQYGRGQGRSKRDFGRLDKNQLDKSRKDK